jgi:hypothetical protein
MKKFSDYLKLRENAEAPPAMGGGMEPSSADNDMKAGIIDLITQQLHYADPETLEKIQDLLAGSSSNTGGHSQPTGDNMTQPQIPSR